MKSFASILFLPKALNVMTLALFLGTTVTHASDQDFGENPDELLKIIRAQQTKIQQQEQALAAQTELLQKLEQHVQKLSGTKIADLETSGSSQRPDQAQSPVSQAEPTKPPADVEVPDWPGSFALFGSKTRLAVSGYAQLDIIHDSDPIDSPCQFITGDIPTDGGNGEGQTSFCVNTSRLNVESQTPTPLGLLSTFLSVDLFGDGASESPELRLREVYGELKGSLWGGDLLVGQAWSTYTDLTAWPDILDFEGPGSAISVRQPMVRWSKPLSEVVKLQLALEEPGDGNMIGADMLSRWPDLVGTIGWDGSGGHVRAAAILRDIRAITNTGETSTATGWGVAGSGSVTLPANSKFLFEASYGKGTGAYYNDGPSNGLINPVSSDIELIPLFGYYVGINHEWGRNLSSTVLYSEQNVHTLDMQPSDDATKSAYFSANLIWRPGQVLMFGVEFLRGGRRDISGNEGTDNRIQLSSQYAF